ncbi:MAG TPA: glycosyltransferase family 39 protein [Bacteroidia bacterium]|jgi:4-amino-4-deoxy-L-arabinose transferase-like glycosyltransferase|nr:glycosyltransferase family 39 protein [Bacteroidia bacterium]
MLQNTYTWIKQHPGDLIKWSIFLLLIYSPIFIDLDVLPLRIWDEARLAESALEMYKHGSYLVPHIQGVPDMWSVKPPLMIWLQVLFMKLLGTGELAVRLPSALAAMFTCILVMFYCLKYLKNFWWGFGSALVILTSHGYMWMHASRSGDYDTLMSFFITLYCLSFYAYSLTVRNKFITITFLGIILAALTKGIAGLLFLPALILFALVKGLVPQLLKNKVFYINIFAFLIVFIGYYLLREHYNPGYIKTVLQDEWGGRYLSVIEGHDGSFWFYYENFLDFQFSYWYLFLLAGIVIGLANKNMAVRDFTLFLTILISVFFLIISLSATKVIWYDVPMYPFMGLIIGGLLPLIMGLAEKIEKAASLKTYSLQYLSIALLFISPYRTILGETYKPDESPIENQFYSVGHLLQNAVRGTISLDNYHFYYKGYSIQDLFYINILNDRGAKITITDEPNFSNGDQILVCQEPVEDALLNKYNCYLIDSIQNVKEYQILTVK